MQYTILRCDIPVVCRLQCINKCEDRHKHNKYLIVWQSWAAIDNYMFRPSRGHRQVVHSEIELIQYVRLNG